MTKFLCGECIHNSDKGGGCLIPKNLGYVDNCNRYLLKDRPIEQTNEEWFDGLSTKEKAKWLSRHSQFMYGCGQMETTPKIMYEEDWEYWLKEKHE